MEMEGRPSPRSRSPGHDGIGDGGGSGGGGAVSPGRSAGAAAAAAAHAAPESLAGKEIAAAHAEVLVLRVQLRNLREELDDQAQVVRRLRARESDEVRQLKDIIGERLDGRGQHAAFLGETAAKLGETLREKEARVHALSEQILALEQKDSSSELERTELASQLVLLQHQASTADQHCAALKKQGAAAAARHEAQLRDARRRRTAAAAALSGVSAAVARCEAAVLPKLFSRNGGAAATAMAAADGGPFSWVNSGVAVCTVGVRGGGPVRQLTTLYVTARDGAMRVLALPAAAELVVAPEAAEGGGGGGDDAESVDVNLRHASSSASSSASVQEPSESQLLLRPFGGLRVVAVARVSASTWKVDATVRHGAMVTSSNVLAEGSAGGDEPRAAAEKQQQRAGITLVTRDGVCLASRTFPVAPQGTGFEEGVGGGGGDVLRHADVHVSPDPLTSHHAAELGADAYEAAEGQRSVSPERHASHGSAGTGGGGGVRAYAKALLTFRSPLGTPQTREGRDASVVRATVDGQAAHTVEVDCGVLVLWEAKTGSAATKVRFECDGGNGTLCVEVPAARAGAGSGSATAEHGAGGASADVSLRLRFFEKAVLRAFSSLLEGGGGGGGGDDGVFSGLLRTVVRSNLHRAEVAEEVKALVEAEGRGGEVARLETYIAAMEEEAAVLRTRARDAEAGRGEAGLNEAAMKREVDGCSRRLLQVTAESKETLEAQQGEIRALKRTLTRVEENYEAAMVELDAAAERETGTGSRVRRQDAELQELAQLCASTQDDFRRCTERHEATLADLRASFAKREAALESQAAEDRRRCEEETAKAAAADLRADAQSRERDETAGELRSLRTQLDASLARLARAQHAQREADEAAEALRRAETDAAARAQRGAALQERVAYLERELAAALSAAERLERARTEEEAALRRRAGDAAADAADAERRAAALRGEVEGAGARAGALEAEAARQRARAEEAEARVRAAEEEAEALLAERAALSVDVREARGRASLLEAQSDGYHAQVRDLQEGGRRLEAALASERAALREAIAKGSDDAQAALWEMDGVQTELAEERARRRTREAEIESLLKQVAYARSALVGVGVSLGDGEDGLGFGTEGGAVGDSARRDLATHAVMTEHNATHRLLCSEQELLFNKIANQFHSQLSALILTHLVKQNTTAKESVVNLERQLADSRLDLIAKDEELDAARNRIERSRESAEAHADAQEAATQRIHERTAHLEIERRQHAERAAALEEEVARAKGERKLVDGERIDLHNQVLELKSLLDDEAKLRIRLQDELCERTARAARADPDAEAQAADEQLRQLQQMVDTLKAERRLDAQQYARAKAQLEEERASMAQAEVRMRSAKEMAAAWEAQVRQQHHDDLRSARQGTYEAGAARDELEHNLALAERQMESLRVELKIQKQRASTSELALREANMSRESLLSEAEAASAVARSRSPRVGRRGGGGGGGGRSGLSDVSVNTQPRSAASSSGRAPKSPSSRVVTHVVNLA